jgi:hypothetical protein
MSDNSWEAVTCPWREAYERHPEPTRKSWLDRQAQLASTLIGRRYDRCSRRRRRR